MLALLDRSLLAFVHQLLDIQAVIAHAPYCRALVS